MASRRGIYIIPGMDKNTDKPIRIGALLSGGGRTLINILDHIRNGKLNAEVVVVIASRQCAGIRRSQDAGLDVELIPYRDYGESRLEEYSNRICEVLDAANVDLVILAGFLSMWLIPERYEGRVINIHPALLPKFGGKGYYGHHVHEAVVAAGEKESGCTVHFVTNEYDAGEIILQRKVPVLDGDSPDDLAARVFEQECIAFPEAIRWYSENQP